MASAYTGQGSRGFKADKKVVAAATLIYTATAAGLPVPSAATAMKTTNLFTEAECANDSKQRNVRRTAQKMKDAADAAAAAAAAAAPGRAGIQPKVAGPLSDHFFEVRIALLERRGAHRRSHSMRYAYPPRRRGQFGTGGGHDGKWWVEKCPSDPRPSKLTPSQS